MTTLGTARARVAASVCAAAALAACALVPGSAGARAVPAADGLSQRLAELARPAVRKAPRAAQADRLDLAPAGPGSLARDGGRVLAEVRFERGAVAGLAGLRRAGARIVHLSRRYQTATVAARPADLEALAAVARVESVGEVLEPVVRGVDCGGAVRSEGDSHLQAAAARAAFAVDGSGVKVGVLSDSFDRNGAAATDAAEDVASGDLPGTGSPCGSTTPIGMLSDSYSAGSDEGRAMAQIVRDLAPGAAIDFATAFAGEAAFADSIRALRDAGSEVIVDDVAYYAEPFFQDGPVAVAVDEVSADGVAYFSAAGNDNLFDSEGRSIASWEAPGFRDAGSCPAVLGGESHCMDFDPGAESDNTLAVTVAAGATLTLDFQWAEPWQGVESDLDVYLLNAAGTAVEASSLEDNPGTSQKPFEFLRWTNSGGAARQVQVVVNHCFGPECNPAGGEATPPRLKVAFLQNGGGVIAIEHPDPPQCDAVGPTIFGHAAAGGAIGTAAVRYDTKAAPESFSSRGPAVHAFGPVDDAGAAPPLVELEPIAKPDLAATDGGGNTFFGPFQAGTHRFYGTSAAAPHAAAVAALLRQADPGAGPAEIRNLLAGTAQPVGAFASDAVGDGLVDAPGALEALAAEAPPAGEEAGAEGFAVGGGDCAAQSGGSESAGPEGEASPQSEEASAVAVPPPPLPAPAPAAPSAAIAPADTVRPRTRIVVRPRKVVRTRRGPARVRFRFGSSERGVKFFCRFDRRRFRRCRRSISKRFGRGRHVVRVKARDAAGNVDRRPAVYRFRVKRVR